MRPRRRKWEGTGGNCVTRNIAICTEGQMGGACGKHGEDRNAYGVLVTPHEGQEPLDRPRLRWKDNIKVDLQMWDGEVWTGLMWLRIVTGGGLL